ncbi:MAG: hypothetical protein IK073_03175, partial [Paludibacteraceae bacterium]|nr:hypothetical protein [Paludibacteraceae bacterium]
MNDAAHTTGNNAIEALRQDRDRWANTAMEQHQYIQQLEEEIRDLKAQCYELTLQRDQLAQQVSTLQNELNNMSTESEKLAPVIKNYGTMTYIAEQKNDVHDCTIYANGMPGTSSRQTGGVASAKKSNEDTPESSRLKKLFLNEFGDEDPQRTTEESQRVRRYVADHNFGNRLLDSARDNPLNVMAICFCAKWQTLHYLTPPVSATALLRFLSDDCGIALATEPKPIANVLAKMLKA